MTVKGKPGEQLAMFMSPREMMDGGVTHANDIWGPGGPAPFTPQMIERHSVWKEKRSVVEHYGLGESVAKEGVHEPLNIYHDTPGAKENRGLSRDDPRGMLRNGHHRFLAQYLADPDRLMPVTHEGGHR